MSCKVVDHPNENCFLILSSKTEVIGLIERNKREDDNIRIVSIGYLNENPHLYFYNENEWADFVELVNIIDKKYKE